MKLLVDMNLSPRWVDLLTAAGFEAQHWSRLGPGDAPDADIMAHARDNGFVVLTHDLDFGAMLAATQGDRPSVVQLRAADLRPEAVGQAVVAALRRLAEELAEGALVTLEPGRSRVRLLPLASRP